MNDNIRRGIRTLFQAFLGLIAAGGLTQLLESFVTGNPVDPTVYLALTMLATAVAAWAQNMIEDATGVALLGPQDREIGDSVIGKGLGAKLAAKGTLRDPITGRDY